MVLLFKSAGYGFFLFVYMVAFLKASYMIHFISYEVDTFDH